MTKEIHPTQQVALYEANEEFSMSGVSMDVADNNDKAVIGYGERCFSRGADWATKAERERILNILWELHDPWSDEESGLIKKFKQRLGDGGE